MTDYYVEAMKRLHGLLVRAGRRGLNEPTAMTLATADGRGRPSARVVLLKDADTEGLVFYTNVTSRKGRELTTNPRAALCFFWDPLMEQVLVEGGVEPVAPAEADVYWATRPRRSQLGAWASRQSQPLPSRATLIARVAATAARFAGRPIPRPPHWSGFRLVPTRIEFWRPGPFRLNERVSYERRGTRWVRTLLYP